MMLLLPFLPFNSRFSFSLLLVSAIGFLASFGTLWDVFGWANLTVLSISLLPLFAIFNILFRSNFRVCWFNFLLYVPLPLSILILYLFQAIWVHPSFPGYPEVLTNQEWIRCLSYFFCFLSIPFLFPNQLKSFWISFACGLAAYGFGTVILTFFSGLAFRAPFDMHFGGPWGSPSNPTPPGLAILFSSLILSYYLLSSSISKTKIVYCLSSIYLISIISALLLNRRSALLFLLLGAISTSCILIKRYDFHIITSFRRLGWCPKSILLIVSSFFLYLILHSRLLTNLFITVTQGPAASDSDRWDRYIYGFPLLLKSIYSNSNLLIDLPSDLLLINVHWHNSLLDGFRIGGLFGFIFMCIWLFYLITVMFSFNRFPLFRVLAFCCLFVLMVEPTLHRTWIDSLIIQFVSIFICFPRKLYLFESS